MEDSWRQNVLDSAAHQVFGFKTPHLHLHRDSAHKVHDLVIQKRNTYFHRRRGAEFVRIRKIKLRQKRFGIDIQHSVQEIVPLDFPKIGEMTIARDRTLEKILEIGTIKLHLRRIRVVRPAEDKSLLWIEAGAVYDFGEISVGCKDKTRTHAGHMILDSWKQIENAPR